MGFLLFCVGLWAFFNGHWLVGIIAWIAASSCKGETK